MNEQKGFIQIPLLIAIIVAFLGVALAGTSIVLYGQGKLALFVANISQVLKGNEDTIPSDQEKTIPLDQGEIEQELSEVEKLKQEIEELKNQSFSQVQTPAPTPKQEVVNTAPVEPAILSNAGIIKKVAPAVVYIETDDGSGSGMIFTSDGYILTNAHVVGSFSSVNISTDNGSYSGRVVGRDSELDLAVVKIDSNINFPVVEFGDSDKIIQGDEIFTLGFPFGIKGDVSFKEGTLSRKIDGYLEISAEIHPGNSGGPLVNRYGQVVGINTSIMGNKIGGIIVGETIKFAIPGNIAKSNIEKLKNGFDNFDKYAYNKQKLLSILMDTTFILNRETDSSCGDSIFQSLNGNYFSAKSKIDTCMSSLQLKKEDFEKLVTDKFIPLPLDEIKDLVSSDDLNYIVQKGRSSISDEINSWTWQKQTISLFYSNPSLPSAVLDFGILANSRSLELAKSSDAQRQEASDKMTQIMNSWK